VLGFKQKPTSIVDIFIESNRLDPHWESSKRIQVSNQKPLLQGLLDHKILIHHSCGGNGTCGTCLVKVLSKNQQIRNSVEKLLADERDFTDQERLSCQLRPIAEMKIRI
jgi:ferredoxin